MKKSTAYTRQRAQQQAHAQIAGYRAAAQKAAADRVTTKTAVCAMQAGTSSY